ncbi:hypothetical protein ES708_25076 [subsurface metagenome]
MDTPDEHTQICQFLVDVFSYMDRTVEFTHRPMSPENRWLSKDAPIVQVIFPNDIVSRRPIDALFVTAHGINQVYRRSNFVDAAVTILQAIAEVDISESVLRYVDQLVEDYEKSPEQEGAVSIEDPNLHTPHEKVGAKRGWQ